MDNLILALVAFDCVLTAVTWILKFSVVLGVIVVIALAIVEACFFVRDIKAAFLHRV